MIKIGLDFDNTLVRYDNLFHRLAVEKGFINQSFQNKLSIYFSLEKTILKENLPFCKAKCMAAEYLRLR